MQSQIATKAKQQALGIWRGKLRRSATTIAVPTAVSRVLGYVREVLMAQFFGTSMATDAWLMASVLPNLLFGALYGSIANLVVPLYLEAKQDPR